MFKNRQVATILSRQDLDKITTVPLASHKLDKFASIDNTGVLLMLCYV